MSTFISKNGVCVPAKEKVALKDKDGNPYIYEGPDRAATQELAEQGITHLGRPWYEDPEMISRIRQVHNISVKEYMKMTGYNEETTLAEIEQKLAVVNVHPDDVKRKPAKKQRSGGANTAGNSGHYEGDFGDLADAKAKVK